ncbi:MAG: hypothetical protein WCF84_24485, partial [Anaerolineae bacterium]
GFDDTQMDQAMRTQITRDLRETQYGTMTDFRLFSTYGGMMGGANGAYPGGMMNGQNGARPGGMMGGQNGARPGGMMGGRTN